MSNGIIEDLLSSAALLRKVAEAFSSHLQGMAKILLDAFRDGNKLLVMGNGGSASQASHLATELQVRFAPAWRMALPVIALAADTTIVTALGNDLGYDMVFGRQIEALGQPGDVALALSTSGQSENVLQGLMTANQRGLTTLALLGGDGGKARNMVDLSIIVLSNDTARVQESHLAMIHAVCADIERGLKDA